MQLGRVSQLVCKEAPSCEHWCADRFLWQAELWRREMHSTGKGILKEDYLRSNRGAALHSYMSAEHLSTNICTHGICTHKHTFLELQRYKRGHISGFNGLCGSGTVGWWYFFSLKSYRKRLKFSHVTDRFLKFCRNGALFQLNKTHFSKKWQMDFYVSPCLLFVESEIRAGWHSGSWFSIKTTGFILRLFLHGIIYIMRNWSWFLWTPYKLTHRCSFPAL